MNKTTGIIVGVVAVLVVGGLLIYGMGNINSTPTTTNATTTSTIVTDTGSVTSSEQTRNPGVPVALTSTTAIPTDTTVVVSGTINPNGAFTSYWYEFGTTANLGMKSPTQMVGDR